MSVHVEGLIILLLIVSAVGSGFLALLVAESKGHGESWFLAGLFMGPIGVIAAAGLGDRISQKHLRRLTYRESVAPEASREIEAESEYQSLVSTDRSPYDIPQTTAQECIQEAVLSIFGNEFESFFKKSTELHRLCGKTASSKLRSSATIDIEQMINGVKLMADLGIIEVTLGPFGGINKIRVLKRSQNPAGST